MTKHLFLCLVLLSTLGAGVSHGFAGEFMMGKNISEPDALNEEGMPVIYDAIESRDVNRVKALLDAGANIEIAGFGGETPVLAAAYGETWDIVLLLLERGGNPHVADNLGVTVLELARKSRIAPDSDEGKALRKVLALYKERGWDQ